MKKYVVLFLITAIVISCTLITPEVVDQLSPNVEFTSPFFGDIETTVTCTGTIEGTRMNTVKLDMPVMVDDLKIAVGETVTKGDTLFTVNKTATLEAVTDESNALEVFNSYQGILGNGNITGSTYDELQQSIQDEVEKQKNSQLSSIPDEVVAPISGKVIDVNVKLTTLNSANQALVTIMNGNGMRVNIEIGEDVISDVSLYMPATITGSGFKNRTYNGAVSRIFPTASTSSTSSQNVVKAYVSIKTPDDYLKPGYSAKVEIVTDTGENLMMIPYETVAQDDENRQYVYVYKNGFAIKQYIETGREGEEGIEILSGLNIEDKIMVDPGDHSDKYIRVNMKDGDSVD